MSTVIGCTWKYGRSFSAATRSASASCSRRVYRVYVLDKDLLTKNMGLYFRFSSSLNNVAFTKISEIAK